MAAVVLALYPRKLNSEKIALLMGSTALTATCRRLDLSLALFLTPVSKIELERNIIVYILSIGI